MFFTITILLIFVVLSIYYTTKMFAGDYDDPIKERVTWYWKVGIFIFFWGSIFFIDVDAIINSENIAVEALLLLFVLAKIFETTSYFFRAAIRRDVVFWHNVEVAVNHTIPEDKKRWFTNKYIKYSVASKLFFCLFLIIITIVFEKVLPITFGDYSHFVSLFFSAELSVIMLYFYLFLRAKLVFCKDISI